MAVVCDDANMGGKNDSGVDFAMVAVREDGSWQVATLPRRLGEELQPLLHALRQQPGEGGTLGFVSVGEDFFVAARVMGHDTRLLLSDVTCAEDWPLAAAVLDHLGLDHPEGDELDDVAPGGDLDIFADLGLSAMDLAMLCENLDLYPDEQIGSVAARLGFGEQYDAVVDSLG